MGKDELKKLVSEKIRETAFIDLNNEREKLSKVNTRSYTELNMQPYLASSKLPTRLKQLFFKWRTRMVKVGWNFGVKSKCPLCMDAEDKQDHLLNCTKLTDTENNCDSNYDTDCDWVIMSTMKKLETAL